MRPDTYSCNLWSGLWPSSTLPFSGADGTKAGRSLRPGAVVALLLLMLSACLPAARAQTFNTLPALSFTKAYAGGNPQAQVITVASSTAANFGFTESVTNISGGAWLSVSPGSGSSSTPTAMTVYATPDAALAAGTYTAQITLRSTNGVLVTTIPVSLTIAAPSATFFDSIAGALTFFMQTSGTAPPQKSLPILNGGGGTLNWTASVSTSDGGNWLTLSAQSGTAPSFLNVGVNPSNLPGSGLIAGAYTGQVVLQTSGDTVTVPVTITVGTSVFTQLNALSFTKAFQGGDPPSQLITAASTSAAFGFTYAVVNSTGGSWLSISPGSGSSSTPQAITVSANPSISLAAGTYGAEIILKSTDGTEANVVPVSLTVGAPTAAFFDALPGALTFFLATRGNAPPAQAVAIRNAGTGALDWTASSSTSDGGSWLVLSATSGTAPSQLAVSINPARLPNGALSAGTFTGQVVLQAGGDTATIPVTVTVGTSVFRQINALSFTKAYQGGDPAPQVITAASTSAAFGFTYAVSNSTGGNWLSISPGSGSSSTPQAITVSANPAVSLAAGTYGAEIILKSTDGTQSSVVPVSLTVGAPTASFFDALPGELTYSMATRGSTPPAQAFQIRNAGLGTMSWTADASTADGNSWLTLSATSGTTPSILSVAIVPANLPNSALSAGTFVGQVVLHTDGDSVTIPVTVTVGTSVFAQLAGLSFTKAFQGGDPLSQVITAASTSAAFGFVYAVAQSTGGSWLSISPGSGSSSTPQAITVAANPAVSLASGTYGAEIVLKSTDGTQASVIPVSLTVGAPTGAFFDALPGALNYFFQTSTSTTLTQAIPIRNAGVGSLAWTASASTADGGNWLSLSGHSGTAPASLSVAVDPTLLPSGGLVAGTYVAEVTLQAGADVVTVPVTVTVGASVFQQLAPLNFSKVYQGANPPNQTFTAASTNAAFGFTYTVVNSTGGNWLSISPGSGSSSTPQVVTVSANPAVSLAAGIYSAEIILKSTDGTQASVIPVTLTISGPPPAAATPVFSPGSGAYTAAQSVIISDGTAGATIYYTTDGSTPTASSTSYAGPITVAASQTLKAIAVAAGYTNSSVGSASYTLVPATVGSSTVAFGSQVIGSTSTAQTLTVTNPGANTLSGFTISVYGTNAADFTLVSNGCASGVAGGGNCTLFLTFTPHGSGTRSASLSIGYAGIGSPLIVSLGGSGTTGPAAALAISGLGAVTVGSAQTITVSVTDAYGNVVPGFTGTVTLTSTDSTATLSPSPYTYTGADAGSHAFNVTFRTAGMFSVAAASGSLSTSISAIAVKDSIWVLNAADQLVRLTSDGTPTATVGSASGSSTKGAVAFDHAGYIWATQSDMNSIVKAGPDGVIVVLPGTSAAGASAPAAIFIDGLGQAWIANGGNGSVSVLSSTGAAVTPSTGYQAGSLSAPSALIIDNAGSVWIANRGANSVTKIFGAAAPVVTPLVNATTNNTLGTRP